jgi:hypothetical protein
MNIAGVARRHDRLVFGLNGSLRLFCCDSAGDGSSPEMSCLAVKSSMMRWIIWQGELDLPYVFSAFSRFSWS